MNGIHVKQRGAILLSVLVVVVMLVLLVASATQLMQDKIALGNESKIAVSSRLAVHGQVNYLKYLLATQRATFAGISRGTNKNGHQKIDGFFVSPLTYDEVRSDAYVYKSTVDDIDIEYKLQADSGLIPINTSKQLWLSRWLAAKGLPIYEISKLQDSLLDYIDTDSWSRPAGAEQIDYEREDVPPPPNYLIQNCHELRNIKGWSELLENDDSILNECRLSRTPSLNMNSVPLNIIETFWPTKVSKIEQLRLNNNWFTNNKSAFAIFPELTLIPDPYFSLHEEIFFILTVQSNSYSEKWYIYRGRGTAVPISEYQLN